MSAPSPVETPTDSAMLLASVYISKTQIRADKVRPSISNELLPDWGGFNQILATGSTVDLQPHAQIQKTVPITKDEVEIVAFQLLESWTGLVEQVNATARTFDAQVASELHSSIREAAQFTFDEISEDDLDLVRPGAIFYWSVGYQVDKFGRRSTQSSLRFKRGKFWTRKEQDSVDQRVASDLDWLKSDTSDGIDDAA